MQIVYRAKDILEAHIVAGLLQSHGLDAHVGGYYLQGAVGDLLPADFATVMVADHEVTAAQAVIADYDAPSQPESDADEVGAPILPKPV